MKPEVFYVGAYSLAQLDSMSEREVAQCTRELALEIRKCVTTFLEKAMNSESGAALLLLAKRLRHELDVARLVPPVLLIRLALCRRDYTLTDAVGGRQIVSPPFIERFLIETLLSSDASKYEREISLYRAGGAVVRATVFVLGPQGGH